MKYRLVFDKTGDEIPFDPVNQDLLDFYIDSLLESDQNKFHAVDNQLASQMLTTIDATKACVQNINKWLADLADIKFEECDSIEYFDQHRLNHYHAVWVQSQSLPYDIQAKRKQLNFSPMAEKIHNMFPDDIPMPPLSVVINKLGYTELYDSLNDTFIHRIETFFNSINFSIGNWTKIADNHFGKHLLTNNIANLSLSFNHLGRTLYDKFRNFDVDLSHNDENSYNELLGFVTVSLVPPQTIPFSAEYVNWCLRHNRKPIGDKLNIGNIPNLYENLRKYRIIFFQNLLAHNGFTLVKI